METYLTVDEVAAALKLSVKTIRRYVLNKEIPYHKISRAVRFKPSEIECWVERRKNEKALGNGEIHNDTLFGDQKTGGLA